MLRSGADHNLLIRSLYQSTDPRYVALYGEVLATLRPLSGGAGVFGLVTTDMLARHHIPLDCLGNELVNTYLRSVLAKYVILAKEDALQGGYRMSLRSKDEKYNMRTLAGVFDGGGHVMASGAYTKKSLEEIIILIETFDFDLPSGEIS